MEDVEKYIEDVDMYMEDMTWTWTSTLDAFILETSISYCIKICLNWIKQIQVYKPVQIGYQLVPTGQIRFIQHKTSSSWIKPVQTRLN